MNQLTEQDFLKQVSFHVMETMVDDGVRRHIRFRKPGTMCCHFDLITWPGYLCYTGDMGTYVFQRLTDMFEFFRTDADSAWLKSKGLTLGVNFSYWAEKVQAGDRSSKGDGVKEFSIDTAHEAVREYVKSHIEDLAPQDFDDDAAKEVAAEKLKDFNEALDDEIFNTSDEWEFVEAIRQFDHDDFYFSDFWEYRTEEYTCRFLWCCYALAWGIKTYDAAKSEVVTP